MLQGCRSGGLAGLDPPHLGNTQHNSLQSEGGARTHTHSHAHAHTQPGTHLLVRPPTRKPVTGSSEPRPPPGLSPAPLGSPDPRLHLLTSVSAQLSLWTRLSTAFLSAASPLLGAAVGFSLRLRGLGPEESYRSGFPASVSLGKGRSLSHHVSWSALHALLPNSYVEVLTPSTS